MKKMQKTNLLPIIHLNNGNIQHVSIINNKENKPIWDMFELEYIETGIKKRCKVITEHNTINSHIPKEVIEKFTIDRLTGTESLIHKEGKSDFIFLGAIKKTNEKYSFMRHYHSFYCEEGKTAQEMFNKVYPSLQKSQIINSQQREPLDDEYTYFFHGANVDKRDKIFKNGLDDRFGPHLGSISYPISQFRCNTLEESAKKYSEYLGRISSTGNKYIYIVKVPKRYYCYTNRHGQKYEMPIFKCETDNLSDTVLINNLIYGVLMAQSDNLFLDKNPYYNPIYNPNGLLYSIEQEENLKLYDNYYELSESASTRQNLNFSQLKSLDEKNETFKEVCDYYRIPYLNNITNQSINKATNNIDLSNAKQFLRSLFSKRKVDSNERKL